MPEETADHRFVVAVDRRSVEEARRRVTSVLSSWGFDPIDDVTLLTSEAITNAVVHADTTAVAVSVERRDGQICVSVHDDDPAVPVRKPFDPDRAGGFGVAIIDDVSESWGVDGVPDDGKDVWFCIDLPTAGDQEGTDGSHP
jgi:anti-sigma regulatory factor (Ser/Thr protein kinase)